MTQTEISLKMVFDRRNASLKSCDNLLNTLTDDALQKQIAPNKNRGIYLLGHLIAVHDDMLILLDMGEKVYPELYEPFIKLADNLDTKMPSILELRTYWTNQCEILKQKFDALTTNQWFDKHTAVSQEEFEKEPHRNKLNIIITRTSHLQYHLGQLVLLK
jgi:hypothetical protein